MRACLCTLVCCWFCAASAVAGELPIEQVINEQVSAQLQEANIKAAPPADDATLVRRLTLDLAGRIPTATEAQDFVASTAADKRLALVDRLLASPDSPRHERNFLDTLLMAKEDPAWRDYLLKTCEANSPWDQRFREILATNDDGSKKAELAFLKARAKNVDDLTRDTSRLFFGVDVSCAKCHDHPLVSDWKQDHYYGIAAFFSRTYLDKDRLADKDQGVFKFKTVKGEEKLANMMFLTGDTVAEGTSAEKPASESTSVGKSTSSNETTAPIQLASSGRRAMLVEMALRTEQNRFFSRSIVNRLWARLLGRGLVMPVDQMHSANPASHPALLDWLAKDLIAHNYDLKRTIRGIVLSEVYGRGSRWEGSDKTPSPELFAVATVRPLSPRQFSLALTIASQNPTKISQQAASADWPKIIADLERSAGSFARNIEVPDENFQVSVAEALLLSNGAEIESSYLSYSTDRLLGHLKAIESPTEMIMVAFWAVLSRPPQADELAAAEAYMAARKDRIEQARSQVVWSLLTSAEFRFNH